MARSKIWFPIFKLNGCEHFLYFTLSAGQEFYISKTICSEKWTKSVPRMKLEKPSKFLTRWVGSGAGQNTRSTYCLFRIEVLILWVEKGFKTQQAEMAFISEWIPSLGKGFKTQQLLKSCLFWKSPLFQNGDGFINRQELGYVMDNLGLQMDKDEIEVVFE